MRVRYEKEKGVYKVLKRQYYETFMMDQSPDTVGPFKDVQRHGHTKRLDIRFVNATSDSNLHNKPVFVYS